MWRRIGVLVLVLLAAGVLGACSDDGDGEDAAATTASSAPDGEGGAGGDDEEFCAVLEDSANEGDDIDLDTPEGLEAFRELADAAPSELEEPMDVIGDALDRVSGLDEDDPDSFGVFFEVFFDPEVLGAFEAVERWGVDNCDLPEDFFEDDVDGDDFGDLGDLDDLEGLDADDEDDDDEDDDDLESSDVREHIESTYGDGPPFDGIFGWTIVNDTFTISFAVDATVDDAMVVCEAAAEYVYDIAGHDEVKLSVSGADGEVLASRDGGSGTCAAG